MDGATAFARWRQCAPHLIRAVVHYLGPPKSKSQTTSWSVQPFVHSWLQSVPILYSGRPLFSSLCPFAWRDLDSHIIYDYLSQPDSTTQTASRLVQRFLQGSLLLTDRPTDHATRSVRIGRIYVRTTVMRPNNNLICTAHSAEDISSHRCRWRADVKVWMSQCR